MNSMLFGALAASPPALTAEEASAARIRDGVFGLPVDERDVFVLSRYQHLTYEQIADITVFSSKDAERLLASAMCLLVQASD